MTIADVSLVKSTEPHTFKLLIQPKTIPSLVRFPSSSHCEAESFVKNVNSCSRRRQLSSLMSVKLCGFGSEMGTLHYFLY